MMAELAVICADTQEVIGSAIGLYLLTGIPTVYGVILTIIISMGILHLQKYGQRIIESIFAAFVGIMGICFFVNYLFIGYI